MQKIPASFSMIKSFLAILLYLSILTYEDSMQISIDSPTKYATVNNATYAFNLQPQTYDINQYTTSSNRNYINITLPEELSLGIGTLSCQYKVSSSSNTYASLSICSFNSTTKTFTIALDQTVVTKNNQFLFLLFPIANPPTEMNGSNFSISIDEYGGASTTFSVNTTYLPNLMLTSVIAQNSYIVSDQNSVNITFQLINDLPSDGYLTVQFPDSIGVISLNAYLYIYDATPISTTMSKNITQGAYKLIYSNPSMIVANYQQNLILQLLTIQNPSSVTSISGIYIASRAANGQRINQNLYPLSMSATIPASISIPNQALSQTSTMINTYSNISLLFSPSIITDSSMHFVFTFPQGISIDLSNNPFCQFTRNWQNFVSGYCSAAKVSGNYIVTTYLAYIQSTYQNVEIVFTKVKMPTYTRSLDPILIQSQNSNFQIICQSTSLDSRLIISSTP